MSLLIAHCVLTSSSFQQTVNDIDTKNVFWIVLWLYKTLVRPLELYLQELYVRSIEILPIITGMVRHPDFGTHYNIIIYSALI